MSIIINGGSYSDGAWWTKHLGNQEDNVRVTLVEVVGLDAETIGDAFKEMEALARNSGSKGDNYFYQANINPRPGEFLTPEERHEAKETLLKNLGLAGQPHFLVEHEKEDGRVHFHVVAFRIDLERGLAISDSFTAKIHERTSRELEIKFDLERGKSILVPDRDFERPERGPKKWEVFRGAESGIDPNTVSADARRALEQSDSGVTFRDALEASGEYVLARGDRRDFLIVDKAGDEHSLARRLGLRTADLRERMADLDPAKLPSLEEAKAFQRERQQEIDRTNATENFDRDAANREWEDRVVEAAIAEETGERAARKGRRGQERDSGGQENGASARGVYAALDPENQPTPPKPERPLSKVQGEIRMAIELTYSGAGFAGALEDRGFILAEVRHADVQHRARGELDELLKAKANGSWMLAEGGARALNDEQRVQAQAAYEQRQQRLDESGEVKRRSRFESYVGYVQKRQGQRLEKLESLVASMPAPEKDAQMPEIPRRAKEGDLVVVTGQGKIYTLDCRSTGMERDELDMYLRTVDRKTLLSVADSHAAMHDVREERAKERAQARIDAPLGKEAGEIRAAWTQSRDAGPARDVERLDVELAARGMTMARVSAAEAYASERTAAFAKAAGNYAAAFKEDEIVIVTGAGHVYRLDERTTGEFKPAIEARLKSVDRDTLLDVSDAKAAMRDAATKAWKAARQEEWEAARPPNAIEQRIATCAWMARETGATILLDAEGRQADRVEALTERLHQREERRLELTQVWGQRAFAARLEETGIAIVRVTEADARAVEVLRAAEIEERTALQGAGTAYNGPHFGQVLAGDFAAVTRSGDVYRINIEKIDQKDQLPTELPGVIETRARFEIEHEKINAIWDEQRSVAAEAREDRDARRDEWAQAGHAAREMRQMESDLDDTVHQAVKGGARAIGDLARGLTNAISFLGDFLSPPPPLTRDQAERAERSAEEKEEASAFEAAWRAQEAAQEELLDRIRRQQQQDEFFASFGRLDRSSADNSGYKHDEYYASFGRPRGDDGGYERER